MKKFEESSAEKMHESTRYLDSGDGVESNPPQTQRFFDNRQPECLEAGECAAYHTHRPAAYRCNSQAEAPRNPLRAQQFTPEMIHDQELLVTSMSQQGIPETLIRRQFDRLIDEQSKQLKLLSDNAKAAEASRIKKSNSDDTRLTPPKTRLEPSSLLKIRMRKEELDFQKRNNGLQDPVVAQNILKKCTFKSKVKKVDDNLMIPQSQLVRLNGVQNRCDMESLEMYPKRDETREKQKSANGLENSRNAQSLQKVQSHEEAASNALIEQEQQRFQEQQQLCHQQQQNTTSSSFNNLTYCSEYEEPRIFGGVTYFVRKAPPPCVTNVPGLPCNNYSTADQNKASRS